MSVIDRQRVHLITDPPAKHWQARRFDDEDRGVFASVVQRRSDLLGLNAPMMPDGPVVGSGHQAQLWHPGILAKFIAARQLSNHLDCSTFHLVVDQDVHSALSLELPVRDGDRLTTQRLQLAPENLDIPTGCQPIASPEVVAGNIDNAVMQYGNDLLVDLAAVKNAFTDTEYCRTLAEQMGLVLTRLMEPYVGQIPVIMTSDLCGLDEYQRLLIQMTRDARGCVAAYNTAVAEHPIAGVTKLSVEPDRVELPLWALRWKQPRRRVYADLADTRPILTDETGQPIDPRADKLVPKALLLTAVIRRWFCDLFIHGKGGGEYDQAMESWWKRWRREPLGKMAVVSSDVYLDFSEFKNTTNHDLATTVWYAHHVKDNLDLELGLTDELSREKQQLLATMDDDRNKVRRLAAFKRMKQINRQLRQQHSQVLVEAADAIEAAKIARNNRLIADKRDWCFALYPKAIIKQLANQLGEQIADVQP